MRHAITVAQRAVRRAGACTCTAASLSASKAEVASSSSRISGRRTSARAMAIRCLWPPLSCTPLSPHSCRHGSLISVHWMQARLQLQRLESARGKRVPKQSAF